MSTLKGIDHPGGRGIMLEPLKFRGGLRFQKIALKCDEGVELTVDLRVFANSGPL